MKIRNYIKKSVKESNSKHTCPLDKFSVSKLCYVKHSKSLLIIGLSVFVLGFVATTFVHKSLQEVTLSEENFMEMGAAPIAATSGSRGIITIPTGITKANPFLPSRNIGATKTLPDVPAYNLVEPPEMVNENSDAARVMDTVVSGILYDKYSPSAILNIEGSDYLVKKGDVVNNYKVLNIMKDSVTVKLGTNVYTAGIGEILTEGSLTYNDVSNLNNKFGGVKK